MAHQHLVEVSPDAWILPNRVGFPEWLSKTFKYDRPQEHSLGLYVHQRFVRDFLQPASPYRGLLLYHGLGVGKTCASIAIADVLRPPSAAGPAVGQGKVYVMLPAFLRGNFIEEVRKCGDPRFRPEQSWTRKQSGKGYERSPGGTPFADFSPEDKDSIRTQIDKDIVDAYTVVHYNGLNSKSVQGLVGGTVNIFDDSVVIIDEAPNVIGQVMHKKLMAQVYQRIMDADRCKVVLLSGTPLVNTPLELAFIANLTHGYISELLFSAIPAQVDINMVVRELEGQESVDHVSLEVLVGGSQITVTLLPSGFVRAGEIGTVAVRSSVDAMRPSTLAEMLRASASSVAGVVLRPPTLQNRFLLPVDPLRFDACFVQDPTNANQLKPSVLNPEVLVRRLLGTVSVYSSTDPALMPTIHPAKIIRVTMSDRQYEEYLVQRDVERQKERAAARFAAAAPGAGDDSKNLYRAFSRAVCTFVFPEGIKRVHRSDLMRTMTEDDEEKEDDGLETGGEERYSVAAARVNRAYDAALEASLALIYADRIKLLSIAGELPNLSPKYASIISHLLEPAGSTRPAIIYSQFRRVEGLGLLRLALIANGFAELRISMRRGALVAEVYPEDASPDAQRFIVYGNDDVDAAASMLKVFNSQLSVLSATLSSSLGTILKGDTRVRSNMHGEIARLLLITQSGSEGISTRNVREVHVIEPFWHANRILQVVGRAARTKSHEDLPQEERTVDVFVYVASFTPGQAADVTITKLDKKRTSDEHILAVATQKRTLLDRFTDIMRRAAVDCVLHHPLSAERRCFAHNSLTLKKGPAALAFQTDLEIDIATQGRLIRLVPFEMDDGRQGLADPLTGDVYDKSTHAKQARFKRIGQRRVSSVARRMGSTRARAAA